MFQEGTALEALESVDSRRFVPHALVATLLVIVAPALVVVALSPLSGIADLVLSALLATGLSVAAGSAGSALWTRLPQSREIPFGDLMLWSWARRVRAERRLAKAAADDAPAADGGELAALRRLTVIFEARDGFTHGHSGRVARHAERIAQRLGLSDAEIERIEAAAAVHDIGLLRVPRSVLAEGPDANPDQRALIERHAVAGAEQVAAVAGPETAAIVRHHHERVDGGGYPDGLAGDEIPLGARIVAVADRFDELVSPAPGRAPGNRRGALDELSARAGSELDAAVVAAFVAYYSGARSIAGVALAATAPQRAVRWIAAAPATIGSVAGAPVALQSICAAGTAALATACLTGVPVLSPDGDGDRPVARAAVADAAAATPGDATERLAASDPDATERRRRERDEGGAGDRGTGPGSGSPPQAPGGGQGVGGGDTTPTSPRSGAGGGQPNGGGGGVSPGAPPAEPAEPVEPPQQVEVPQLPSNPTSQVVDPVLDGVSEAVPQTKPLTDAVKGLVGGLAGGLTGGGR